MQVYSLDAIIHSTASNTDLKYNFVLAYLFKKNLTRHLAYVVH